ncbi:hypothetical protein [Kamptonema sp. UHCC 0994]|uniref:hypothetical protein n=1 Tax=Kamptonema sp. UHCC 0994 TaxID=3031329 RepID=UPI0023B9F065|nr:hypothetical protein [Kamptonema sp. UHCC 0994]MDF0552447.1 hypothetical protein [Kamptonema sp. UHCC 0994]
MSEDQPQKPQSEQPQPEIQPIATSQNAAKTPQDSAKLDRSLLDKLSSAWLTVVQFVRSLLPASIDQKLSDTVLSSAIAAILIVAIGTTLTLLSGKSPEIVVIPSPESPEITIVTSPESPEIVVIPSPESSEITIVTSPEPTATNLQEPIVSEETKTIEITPPSPPKLTPEQNFIATIQNQVDELTHEFNNSLVESIQVNFFSSLLTVKVGDDWYNLPESEQNQLASQIFKQSQKLEFRKLEIANSQGKLIARSPVIGSEMIILERKKAESIGNA